ncbi:MAG: hypothetical protein Q8N44_11005 [Rubrivivax sp.]|nr:hypothetical protein [Rubrivivax sp.]MDP3084202.1 hypothetical protein [Rubrivivax sp.]
MPLMPLMPLMLLMRFGVLGVEVHSVPRFVVTLVLLVLQLAAAGATMPIELTTPFFQAIHPYLSMTWVVRTLRIAMFRAFEGAWASSAAVIAAVAAACVALATAFGRWRPVDPEAYRPQIETD